MFFLLYVIPVGLLTYIKYVFDQLTLFSPPADPTLTLTSLTQVMVSVKRWGWICGWLHIPRPVYADIWQEHSDIVLRVEGWCKWYLTHHPAPSWRQVETALYSSGEHENLDVLRSHLEELKGRSHEAGSLKWGDRNCHRLSLLA